MSALTPEQARAYLARWQMVRQAEVAELLRTPMETKLRQLNALMTSRNVFVDPQRQQD